MRLKNEKNPKEFYNPKTDTYSKTESDGFYPLIMWIDGRHSELLYQKGRSVCYNTLPCYRFDENCAMALSESVLRYVTKETYERYMKRFVL